MDYQKAQDYIFERLKNELGPDYRYHNLEHTLDVLQSVEILGKMEKINGNDMLLIKTAALFHDAGMLIRYNGHEDESADLAKKILPQFGYTDAEIEAIHHMILTTRLPQSAHTHLEQILCDADLDYLGREDFFMIAHRLKYEWNRLNINKITLKKWYELQLAFLQRHTYYTQSAARLRQEKKKQNLTEVNELLIKHDQCS
jgi:predicted metal-dependent HD superfamily phosphohydrolase